MPRTGDIAMTTQLERAFAEAAKRLAADRNCWRLESSPNSKPRTISTAPSPRPPTSWRIRVRGAGRASSRAHRGTRPGSAMNSPVPEGFASVSLPYLRIIPSLGGAGPLSVLVRLRSNFVDAQEIISRALALLELPPYFNVATASDDQPWNSPVWAARDAALNLYWSYWVKAIHSQNVEKNPRSLSHPL